MKLKPLLLFCCYHGLVSAQTDTLTPMDTSQRVKHTQSFAVTIEPLQRHLGAQYLVHFDHFKIGPFYQHSWNNRWLYDTVSSGLPYLVNDTAVFYEVNTYENKKSVYGLNIETNFNPQKNNGKIILGVSAYTGKYSFQQYFGDTYFKYYTDSTGNVYYRDMYDDPNDDPMMAFRFTQRYSQSEAVYRLVGIDPYLGYTGPIRKNITLGVFLKGKYTKYRLLDRYYFDPSQSIHEPLEEYSKLQLSFQIILSYYFTPKS